MGDAFYIQLGNDQNHSNFTDNGNFPDFDFSEFSGNNLKKSLKNLKQSPKRPAVPRKQKRPSKRPMVQKPLTKNFAVNPNRKTKIVGPSQKNISKVLVPRDKEVIIKGVSQFMMKDNDPIKNIGYYKGKKLKELVLIINNEGSSPLVLDLFNPSMPLDYVFSTSQNLNDRIQVAGGVVSYSDVLFNLLANPTMIANCKFLFAGANAQAQKSQSLFFTNKEITGSRVVDPLNLELKIDNLQVANDIVFFDLVETLKAPYFPDGMDTIGYTVLPGTSVTMAFFFEQKLLKHAFYPESKSKRNKFL